MPCRCDHMEPHKREVELSRVLTLIDEVETGNFEAGFYDSGRHPEAWFKDSSQDRIDRETAKLCAMLYGVDVHKFSLELQIWWRDHQALD